MRLKLIFIIAVQAVLISSCGSGGEEKEQTGPAKEDITKTEVYQKGLTLVAGKKCLTIILLIKQLQIYRIQKICRNAGYDHITPGGESNIGW
jgi:hypothetical protein